MSSQMLFPWTGRHSRLSLLSTLSDQLSHFLSKLLLVPLNGLPKSWEWEYAIPRSANITSEEEVRKAKYFTFKVGDIIPVYSKAKNGFNLSIRPNFEYYGFHLENWYDLYKNDPFMFYKKLVNALHELYIWAVKLPVYQSKPKERKKGFFKSKF